jgi:hypothetical protein
MKDRWRFFKTSLSPIGQKEFDSQVEKCEMSGSKSKSKDKNRFILIKEIVEKNGIVDISKDYLKGNVPSTVKVLRAGK